MTSLWHKLTVSASILGVALFVALTPHLSAQSKDAKDGKDAKEAKQDAANPDESKEETKGKAEPPAKVAHTIDVMAKNVGGAEQVAYINDMLDKQWKDNKITPSERCSEYEFIRRASLDIIGRIAKPEEIDRYLKDAPERRRSLLIERLLASDEFPEFWSNLWTINLLTRSNSTKLAKEQMSDWLTDKFTMQYAKNDKTQVTYAPDWSQIATEILTATGRTNDNGAVNYILTHLGEAVTQDKQSNGSWDMVPVTSRTTRLFLGLRTQCVQCHDHPFNPDWAQTHFWGINAFFRQVDTPRGRPTIMANQKKQKGDLPIQFELVDNPVNNPKGMVSYERRNGVLLFTDATFLDGKKAKTADTEMTRRGQLAHFVVTSPYFGKEFVNRTWAHFFGKSFTKDAVDDFGDHNPASNPELLNRLADDWTHQYNHNPVDLIRWICNSRAYGLSSVVNKSNDKPEDETLFSHMLLKPMSPEQLFDSLMTATQAKVGQTKSSRVALKENWLDRLIANFGDDEGNEVSYNGTVVQALLLMNGKDINDAINDANNGTVANVLAKRAFSADAAKVAMKDLYLAALNRPPRTNEVTRLLSDKVAALPKAGTGANAANFWKGYYQDLFWAILNSNEFILNH